MDSQSNIDPNDPGARDSAKTPKMDPDPSLFEPEITTTRPSQAVSAFAASGRIEANTAFLKIGQNSVDVSGFESTPYLDNQSGITPAEDDDGGEAASARIAQEYRRQVRIKRLAEEIQQAERAKKKEDDFRRKTDTQLKSGRINAKREETAKLQMVETINPAPESEAAARKRADAMIAFKTAAAGRKSRTGLLFAFASLVILGALVAGAFVFFNKQLAQREKENKNDMVARALVNDAAREKAAKEVKELQDREAELLRQKKLAEESAAKALADKLAVEAQFRKQDEERQALMKIETDRRAAEERRLRDENERLQDEANRQKEDSRKKVEESQRIAREKLKKEQQEEAARIELAAQQKIAAEAAKAEAAKAPPAATETKPDVAKPKTLAELNGPAKTIPADPQSIPDKLELPSGGVRLFVKASDPYGGKLAFQWRQVKGTTVDIADPGASLFRDGKWISQTYFVAREPGNYEFEVIVKNDDGVESKKKFPIEVLPPTTLK